MNKMSIEDVVSQIQSLNDQSMTLQMRVEQAEQEVIRQRGAIEQSAHVVASVSLGQVDSMSQVVQVMGKRVLEEAVRVSKSLLFNNNRQDFAEWQRETANYLNSTMEGLGMVMDCAVDEEDILDWKIFKESHLGQYDIELEEMNERVYYWLVDHTEGESFDLVRSAGNGYGLEAWRRLNRRWSSSATGSSEQLRESVMNPGRSRLEDLIGSIERLEKHIKKWVLGRRNAEGDVVVTSDENEMILLKQLLPKEVERQLQRERASLLSYSLLLAEVKKSSNEEPTEAVSKPGKSQEKLGSKTKEQSLVSDGGRVKQQIDYPGKGKGKVKGKDQRGKDQRSDSKGKSKGDERSSGKGAADMKKIQCHHCKKFGHYARDCWASKGGKAKGGKVKYQPNCMRCDSLTGPHYREQHCSACGAQWPEHLWGPRCQGASKALPKGDSGKDVSSKGKGKLRLSSSMSDTQPTSQIQSNRLDLGCLDQRLESINSVMTIGPGGRPIYDSLWVSEAIEKVATAKNMVNGMKIAYLPEPLKEEDKSEKRKQTTCKAMSTSGKQSLKNMATVAVSSLTGAQATQGNGVWPSDQVIGTRVQKMMVCMMLMAIITIWISRWLLKTQWKAPRRAAETLRRMLREWIESDELDPAEAERIEYYHSSSVREAALRFQHAASSREIPENRLYTHDDDVDGWGPNDDEEFIYEMIDRELARPVAPMTLMQRRVQQEQRDQQVHRDQQARQRRARNTFLSMNRETNPGGKGQGGDLIQFTEEQCLDMGIPRGSVYRGGLILLPSHPKGSDVKGKGKGGDLSPLEYRQDVLDSGMNDDSWVRMNLDTGAAIHAFPASLGVANMGSGERYSTTSDAWYTTASGDEIPDMGQLELTLKDETQRVFQLLGNVTRVHKCLVSASKLCQGGRNVSTKYEMWLDGEGGYLYPSDGPIAQGLAKEYKRLVKMHGSHTMIPVYQERGVYNVYFRLLARDRNPIYLTEETDEQGRDRVVRSSQQALTRMQRVERIEAENRRGEYMPSGLPDWASYRLAEMGLAEPENRGDITDTWNEDDEPMMAAEAATDSP